MRAVLLSLIIATSVATAAAQQSGSAESAIGKQFEVASVKLSPPTQVGPGMPVPSLKISGSGLDVHTYPLNTLLEYAFGNPPYARFVLPESARTLAEIRIDIQAIIPAGSSKTDVQHMLRRLLAERMGLRFHIESRVLSAYDLVVDPGGAKLQPVEESDDRAKEFKLGEYDRDFSSYDGEYRRIMTAGVGNRWLTARSNYVINAVPLTGAPAKYVLEATRISMEDFAKELYGRAGRPVFDATGLTGVYRLSIDLPAPSPAATTQRLADMGITTTKSGEPLDTGFGTARVDLPKQLEKLGLKLVDRKSPMEVTVIDNINGTPTEN